MTSDWVIESAEMSSVIALRFCVSLARSGAPVLVQPTATASASASNEHDAGMIHQLIRSRKVWKSYRR